MNYGKLRNELSGDPLGRGYSEMSGVQVAADLNTDYRTRNKDLLTGDSVFQQTVPAEFGALTDSKKSQWLAFCARDIDPFAIANEEFVKYIFGNTSTTVSNLASVRVESISRSSELGLGPVRGTDVNIARNL